MKQKRFLGAFLASVDLQTRRPDALILVDHGPADRATWFARCYAEARDWAYTWSRPRRLGGHGPLAGAPDLDAFLWAVERLPADFDVVACLDADVRLAAEHVDSSIAVLEAEPDVGVVYAGTRFYRRECLDEIVRAPHALAWDGGEARAASWGWRTVDIELPKAPAVSRPGGSGRLTREF